MQHKSSRAFCWIRCLLSASVARVWRYKNLIITIIIHRRNVLSVGNCCYVAVYRRGGRLCGARRYGALRGRRGAGAYRVATRTACCIKKAASVWLHHPNCLVTRSYTCSVCSRQSSPSGLASANSQTDMVTHC